MSRTIGGLTHTHHNRYLAVLTDWTAASPSARRFALGEAMPRTGRAGKRRDSGWDQACDQEQGCGSTAAAPITDLSTAVVLLFPDSPPSKLCARVSSRLGGASKASDIEKQANWTAPTPPRSGQQQRRWTGVGVVVAAGPLAIAFGRWARQSGSGCHTQLHRGTMAQTGSAEARKVPRGASPARTASTWLEVSAGPVLLLELSPRLGERTRGTA
ncbi:uncharacterized protein BDZ99DRAFT_476972 [Mytilinidion resinicola]|uniref:Uncharacterized protein n=1 Tax=Mytilinidion resinicola TaxID=574789 RepID=A0A6A6YL20_9PEZI|nr:uncharacterized protein BDZ99DRAFT_476972 [Mytilinidion resinicola]KAF2809572.1 hypothetical protein BDZ99DRAFT_476972 [Mytilinidion resinicola]